MSVLEIIVLDAEQNPVMKCAESKFFINSYPQNHLALAWWMA